MAGHADSILPRRVALGIRRPAGDDNLPAVLRFGPDLRRRSGWTCRSRRAALRPDRPRDALRALAGLSSGRRKDYSSQPAADRHPELLPLPRRRNCHANPLRPSLAGKACALLLARDELLQGVRRLGLVRAPAFGFRRRTADRHDLPAHAAFSAWRTARRGTDYRVLRRHRRLRARRLDRHAARRAILYRNARLVRVVRDGQEVLALRSLLLRSGRDACQRTCRSVPRARHYPALPRSQTGMVGAATNHLDSWRAVVPGDGAALVHRGPAREADLRQAVLRRAQPGTIRDQHLPASSAVLVLPRGPAGRPDALDCDCHPSGRRSSACFDRRVESAP